MLDPGAFYPGLSVSIGFIGGFLGGGWALSREVNEINSTYNERVIRFKGFVNAHFASELWALNSLINKSKQGKKVTTLDLLDPMYVDKIKALYDWVQREKDADNFYESMIRSCSQGAKGLILGAVLLAGAPILLLLDTPDLNSSFVTIGVFIAMFAAFAAYASALRVTSYWRNRDRLLKLLKKEEITMGK